MQIEVSLLLKLKNMDAWLERLKREYKTEELPPFENPIEGIRYRFEDQVTPLPAWETTSRNNSKPLFISYHFLEDSSIARQTLMHDLQHGTDGILLEWEQVPDFEKVLDGVEFQYLQTIVSLGTDDLPTSLWKWIEKVGPVNFHLESEREQLKDTHPPMGYKISGFNAYACGANALQELCYVGQKLQGFLEKKSNREVIIELGVGENFIVELAKFQALHWMIEALVQKNNHFPNLTIRTKTGWRNKTSFSVHDNQLRLTTEALCASLSGCHQCCITPYNFAYGPQNDFFVRRMALNVGHILQHEAHVLLPESLSEGSAIIAHHAHFLCDSVWKCLDEFDENSFQTWIKSGIYETNRLRSTHGKALYQRNEELVAHFKSLRCIYDLTSVYFQNLPA